MPVDENGKWLDPIYYGYGNLKMEKMMPVNKQTTRAERAKLTERARILAASLPIKSDTEYHVADRIADFTANECTAFEKEYGEALKVCTDNIATYHDKCESLTAALKDAREGFDQIRTESDQEQIRDIAEKYYLNLTNIERAEVKGDE